MMQMIWNKCATMVRMVRRLARDETGAEGLEKLLIITAIVLPLLVILLFFKDTLAQWLGDSFETVRQDTGVDNQDNPFN